MKEIMKKVYENEVRRNEGMTIYHGFHFAVVNLGNSVALTSQEKDECANMLLGCAITVKNQLSSIDNLLTEVSAEHQMTVVERRDYMKSVSKRLNIIIQHTFKGHARFGKVNLITTSVDFNCRQALNQADTTKHLAQQFFLWYAWDGNDPSNGTVNTANAERALHRILQGG